MSTSKPQSDERAAIAASAAALADIFDQIDRRLVELKGYLRPAGVLPHDRLRWTLDRLREAVLDELQRERAAVVSIERENRA